MSDEDQTEAEAGAVDDGVLYVRGEGGVIWKMTPPLGEGIEDRLTKGYLKLVDKDGNVLPWSPVPVQPLIAETNREAAQQPPQAPQAPQDGTGAAYGGQPARNAAKAEWVGWAVTNGMEPDEAEALTKQDLIDQFGF